MLEDIRGRVDSGSVLVDVGANIGNHAIYFGKICKASKVYAFEPQSEVFRILKRNILINDLEDVVSAHCVGLGESAGSARLGPVMIDNRGMTKLEVDADGPVELAKLDDFFLEKDARVDVLKIDVEGMECDVLRGASRILREHGPLVYAEAGTGAQFQELHGLLKTFGYQPMRRFNATPTYLFEKQL